MDAAIGALASAQEALAKEEKHQKAFDDANKSYEMAQRAGASEQLLQTLAANSNVKEINIVAHSMGNWVTLEALRGMSIRNGKIGAKVRNVMLVAPDVDVDVFRTQIQRMGTSRPRFALFVSQDDKALKFSETIWGGVQRLGQVDPAQEPYVSELQREHIEVYDLTKLKGNAHDRAFSDITEVVAMIKNRVGE